MITPDAPDVLGHCTFCDEIRTENTGKLILIGVYSGTMVLHGGQFPFELPRLGISIVYMQRRRVFIAPKFVIFLPGDNADKPSIETELPQEVAAGAVEKLKDNFANNEDPKNAFATVHANFNFGSLPIKQPGLIKVRAVRAQELFRLGTMRIEQAPPIASPAPQSAA